MAFESLLARLGPTLVRETAPHLLQLVSAFGDRFRKDTREMKEAVDAEIASLGRAQAAVGTALTKQSDALESLRLETAALDQKVDLLLEGQQRTARQLAALEQQVSGTYTPSPAVAFLTLLFSLLAFAAAAALLVLRK